MDLSELQLLLDTKAAYYNQSWFVESDPIVVPHAFSKKEDVEIAAFLTATMAWGQRKMIVAKARQLMAWMDGAPHDFVTSAGDRELQRLSKFVYRTFKGVDCQYFVAALGELYRKGGGLEGVFTEGYRKGGSVWSALAWFREQFMDFEPMARTGKHVANVLKGSSAKRLNMFLRWMVRTEGPVDFGLWKGIPPAALQIPLDVHVGRVARELGLLQRKQDDRKAVEELTEVLKIFRPHDPVYYDYALFGLGVFEKRS